MDSKCLRFDTQDGYSVRLYPGDPGVGFYLDYAASSETVHPQNKWGHFFHNADARTLAHLLLRAAGDDSPVAPRSHLAGRGSCLGWRRGDGVESEIRNVTCANCQFETADSVRANAGAFRSIDRDPDVALEVAGYRHFVTRECATKLAADPMRAAGGLQRAIHFAGPQAQAMSAERKRRRSDGA